MSDQQPDLGALLQQAQILQEQMLAAQSEAEAQIIDGIAGGGKVKVTVSGALEFQKVHIDPDLLDDAELLEDLLLAALHDAVTKVNALKEEAAAGAMGGFGGMLGQ